MTASSSLIRYYGHSVWPILFTNFSSEAMFEMFIIVNYKFQKYDVSFRLSNWFFYLFHHFFCIDFQNILISDRLFKLFVNLS